MREESEVDGVYVGLADAGNLIIKTNGHDATLGDLRRGGEHCESGAVAAFHNDSQP